MKFIVLAFGLGSVLPGFTQGRVKAAITGFKNEKGVCRACIFNNAESFAGKGKPVQCVTVNISNKKTQVEFQNLPVGEYAVSVFHDANNNNQFDTNFLGIPKEGYGASRNNLPFAAAPGYQGNKFLVEDKSTSSMTIKLRNL